MGAARAKRNNALSVRLCAACAKDDIATAQRLLSSSSIDVSRGDYDRRTPLHIAAGRGHKALATLLIASNADVSARDRSGRTPLFEALQNGQDALVALLESHGAPLNVLNLTDSLCAAAAKGSGVEELRYLIKGAEGELSSLSDDHGRTPLHVAAAAGHAEHVKLLIEAKANLNSIDAYGGTPLLDAFRNGHQTCSELLLQHGAALGEKFDAAYALCEAAAADDVDTLGRLLAHKCDVDAEDFDGRTALHIAAAHHRIAACTFLLAQNGIKVNHEDRHGDTAYDDALRSASEVRQVVSNLIAAFGGKAGGHVLRPSVERSLAEQHKAARDIARVETMRLLLVKAKRATGWTKEQTVGAHTLLKEARDAVALEEAEGPVLADAKPQFLKRLWEYAQAHPKRVAYMKETVLPLLSSWQEQADQYGQLKQELGRRLSQLSVQVIGVQPALAGLLEITFRDPEDPMAVAERRAAEENGKGDGGERRRAQMMM